jgi:uncharacterized protein (TIGR01777 family)
VLRHLCSHQKTQAANSGSIFIHTLIENMKKILITGGTGFLGQYLTKYFTAKGYHIYIISRSQRANQEKVTYLQWDGKTQGEWSQYLENAEAVINLAGKSVNCRYTETNKRIILESRINATNAIGTAIQNTKNPPKVWLNGGSATIYRYSEDMEMTETNGELGAGFSVDVCKAWEKTFDENLTPHTRKIFMRISIVLGKDGGVIPVLKRLIRFGLGGTQGHGRQRVSWLHVHDFARIVEWLIANNDFKGTVNCVSPNHVSNAEFMSALRKKYSVPFGLPQPAWMLKIGAALIGTETELILKSRQVVPDRLIQAGFKFDFEDLETALADFEI